MNNRLKGDDNISKNKTHVSKAGVWIKKQVDKALKEKGRDASTLLISVIVVKVAQKAPIAMLHDVNNNPKPQE